MVLFCVPGFNDSALGSLGSMALGHVAQIFFSHHCKNPSKMNIFKRLYTTEPKATSFTHLLRQTKKTFSIPEIIHKPRPLHQLFVNSTKNNTIISIALNGNVKFQSSGGQCVKKHLRKSSDAGAQALLKLLEKIPPHLKTKQFDLIFKGFGRGRDAVYRTLRQAEIPIARISDQTPVRHGGCRPKKQRRI
jgi:small subunit ribosomal protein S11